MNRRVSLQRTSQDAVSRASVAFEYATDKIPGIPFARSRLDETGNKIDSHYQDSNVWFYIPCVPAKQSGIKVYFPLFPPETSY